MRILSTDPTGRFAAAISGPLMSVQGRYRQFVRQGSSRRGSETAHPQPEVGCTSYSCRVGPALVAKPNVGLMADTVRTPADVDRLVTLQ